MPILLTPKGGDGPPLLPIALAWVGMILTSSRKLEMSELEMSRAQLGALKVPLRRIRNERIRHE